MQRQSFVFLPMKSALSKKTLDPILLLLLAVLTYGLVIPKLGLFGDDWPHLWVFHMFGMEGLNNLVAWDRPFSSWVYGIIAPLANDHIWAYHVYLLILRWISAVLFYYLIKEIIPDSDPFPFWAASFLLIYPGFRQQPQPLEFILHFTIFDLMLVSFICMMKAGKDIKTNWPYQVAGTLASLSIFSVEYFIGLELLRPILLFINFQRSLKNWKTAIYKTAITWFPYIVVLGCYAYWRMFIFKFPTYKPTFLNQVGLNPIQTLIGLLEVLVEEIRAAILGAWRQVISIPLDNHPGIIYYLLICVSFIFVFISLTRKKVSAETTSPLIPLLMGSVAIILAGIPFWITGIPVQLEFPWDRSTLPFMVGSSLLLAGCLLLFRPAFRNAFAALIIAGSVGMHYQNVMLYQLEWQKLNQFFWQLSWRAPSFQPGTIVISEVIPLFYYGDNNLTPILNWTYAPQSKSTKLAYNFFDMGERLGSNLSDLKPNISVSHGYRFLTFESNSNNLLPVVYKDGSCLRIVDEQTVLLDSLPKRLKKVASFTHPEERILPGPQSTPPSFMPEPEHGWCYIYQKSELAVQLGKWSEVRALYDDAEKNHMEPNDLTENMPFIEAFIRIGDIDSAAKLARSSLKQENSRPAICNLWNKLAKEDNEVGRFTEQAGCD